MLKKKHPFYGFLPFILGICFFTTLTLTGCTRRLSPKDFIKYSKSPVSLIIADFTVGKKAKPPVGLEKRIADRVALEIDARYAKRFKGIYRGNYYRHNHPNEKRVIIIQGSIVDYGKSGSVINQWLNQYGTNKFRAVASIIDGNTGDKLTPDLSLDHNIYKMDNVGASFILEYTLEDAINEMAKKITRALLKVKLQELS